MRVMVLALLVLVSSRFAQAQYQGFVIKGDLSALKAPAEMVYLNYYLAGQSYQDSARVKDDHYRFAGNITEPVQAGLRVKYKESRVSQAAIPFNSKRDYAVVFLEPSEITVTSVDSFSNVTVAGSKADDEYRKLQLMAKPYDDQLALLYVKMNAAKKENNPEAAKMLEQMVDSIDGVANEKVYGAYVKAHPASPVALYALRNWAGYEMDADKVEPVFKMLPASTRNTVSGKDLAEKIAIAKKTGIGQVAMDFTQNDTLGKPVSLGSFRGKYVLLDFWASWCGPCRAENPNLVKAFNKYKEKGFQVLSVSLDRPGAKDRWLKAIHDDGLQWYHVSDLQFWNNAVARQYGIEAIPQNLLIDPDGKIVGKNLQGEKLEQKLASIYTN